MKSARLAPLVLLLALPSLLSAATRSPVAVTQDDYSFTLDNGIIRATASKRSGDLTSLKFRGQEMLNIAAKTWHYKAPAEVQTIESRLPDMSRQIDLELDLTEEILRSQPPFMPLIPLISKLLFPEVNQHRIV